VLLFGKLFSNRQKSIREIKQARLVNILLGIAMKRTHALRLLLYLKRDIWSL